MSTADNRVPIAPRRLHPLDMFLLYGKPMRWWQEHGLFEKAWLILLEHECRKARIAKEVEAKRQPTATPGPEDR